jgi:hypothetical protein
MLPSASSILDTYKFNRISHFTRQESGHRFGYTKERSGNIDPCFDVVLPSASTLSKKRQLTSTHSGPPPPPNPSASGSASTHFMLLVSSGYQRSLEALQILFISLLLMRERGNLPSLQFLPFYPSVELSNL